MLYRLIVMRHAKSSWDSEATTDHARPLNPRGCRDAPRMAQAIEARGWLPEVVLSSDSQRTKETYLLMLEAWSRQPPVDYQPEFYHGGIEEIQVALSALSDDCQTAMVLGHNPGWEHACAWLVGHHQSMTTANAALMQINARNWREAAGLGGDWTLVELLRPKELK